MSLSEGRKKAKRSRIYAVTGVSVIVVLLVTGVMARNGWFPSTDPMTGERTVRWSSKTGHESPGSPLSL